MISSWIIQMCLKSNDKCLYRKKKRRHWEGRAGSVNMKTESGAVWLPSRGSRGMLRNADSPWPKDVRKNSFPEVGNTAPTTPLLWHSGHERILFFFFFNYHICGSLHCERKLIEMEIRRWRWENDMIDYYMEGRQVCTRENPGKYSS